MFTLSNSLDNSTHQFYNNAMDFQLKKLDTVITVSEIANVHFFEFPKGYETIDDQHPFYELIYVGTGSIDVHSDEYSGRLEKNELLIHRANSKHSFSCPKKAETTLIILGFTCMSEKLHYFASKPLKLDEMQIKQLADIVKEGRNVFAPPYNVPVYDMVKKKNALYGSEQMLRSLLELFLIGLIRKYEFFENSDDAPRATFTISEIIEYLDNNFTEKITIEELAFLFRTNRSTLCKEFRKATNKSLGEYLADKKIEVAKKLLAQKEKSITQIADALNFDSVPYFCEFFKRQTGLTPLQYRQKADSSID